MTSDTEDFTDTAAEPMAGEADDLSLRCQRLTAITPRRAKAARRFLDAFGFKREGLIRKGFGDDDAVVSGMLKREWEASRWLSGRCSAVGRVSGCWQASDS